MSANLQEKLAEWRPAPGRQSIHIALEGWSLHLTADRNDTLASLAWELVLTRKAEAPPALTLKRWAEDIAKKATGLMEDLKVLEIDTVRNEAQLRSEEPSRKGPVAAYYEIMLQGLSKATVRRFEADTGAGTKRTQVPFALTHEVLSALVSAIVN